MAFDLHFWDASHDFVSAEESFLDPTQKLDEDDVEKKMHIYLWMSMSDREFVEFNDDTSILDAHGSPKPVKGLKTVDVDGVSLFQPSNVYMDMPGIWWLKIIFTKPGYTVDRYSEETRVFAGSRIEDGQAPLSEKEARKVILDEVRVGLRVAIDEIQQLDRGPSPLPMFSGTDLTQARRDDSGRFDSVSFDGVDDRPTMLIFMSTTCPCSGDHQDWYPEVLLNEDGNQRYPDVRIVGLHSIHGVSENKARTFFSSGEKRHRPIFPVIHDPARTIARYYEDTLGLHFTTPFTLLFDGKGFEKSNLLYHGSPSTNNRIQAIREEEDSLVGTPLTQILSAVQNNRPLPFTQSEGVGCLMERR